MPSLAAYALALTVAAADPAAPAPGGSELWQSVRDAYRALPAYEDRGSVDRAGAGRLRQARFELVASGEAFRWTVELGDGRRVIWRDDAGTWLFDGPTSRVRAVARPLVEIGELVGDRTFDAFLVPALLLGADPLGELEASAVEGPVDCDGASCWRLIVTRSGGEAETRLDVDRASFLIRRAEATIESADLPPRSFLVRHTPRPAPAGLAAAFALPEGVTLPAAATAPEPETGTVASGFGETISVELVTIVARVTDDFGAAIARLEPADFVVRLGGREIPVVAVDWVDATSDGVEPELADVPGLSVSARQRPEPPKVVFYLQADTNSIRIKGHLSFLPYLRELVDVFTDSPKAVVSFDGHFKLWRDFARGDDEGLMATLEHAFRWGGPSPLLRESEKGALALRLDFAAAEDAVEAEEGLLLLGKALRDLPGEKVIFFVGWGLGELKGRQGVRRSPVFDEAVANLRAAQTTVHVLDVTQADLHTLAAGLADFAAATGGTYAETFRLPARATHQLVRTVTGRYLLSLDGGALPPGGGEIEVEVRGRRANVVVERVGA